MKTLLLNIFFVKCFLMNRFSLKSIKNSVFFKNTPFLYIYVAWQWSLFYFSLVTTQSFIIVIYYLHSHICTKWINKQTKQVLALLRKNDKMAEKFIIMCFPYNFFLHIILHYIVCMTHTRKDYACMWRRVVVSFFFTLIVSCR